MKACRCGRRPTRARCAPTTRSRARWSCAAALHTRACRARRRARITPPTRSCWGSGCSGRFGRHFLAEADPVIVEIAHAEFADAVELVAGRMFDARAAADEISIKIV